MVHHRRDKDVIRLPGPSSKPLHTILTCLSKLMESLEEGPVDWTGVIWIPVVLVIIIVLFSLFDHYGYFKKTTNKLTTFYVLFEFNIRSVFKGQKKEVMSTLKTGVQSVLHSYPERPAILFLMAPCGTYPTTLCIAKRLAQVILKTFDNCLEEKELDRITLQGVDYTAFEDYWLFHKNMSTRIEEYNVVLVTDFQAIHPQVTPAVCSIADDTFSPYPQSVIIIVADVDRHFSWRDLSKKNYVKAAEEYLDSILEPFLDTRTLDEVKRYISGRAVIIEPEKFQQQEGP